MDLSSYLPSLPPQMLVGVQAGLTFVASALVLLTVRGLLLRQAHRWAARARVEGDVVATVVTPSFLCVLALALAVTVRASPLPDELRIPAARVLDALVIFSATLVSASVAAAIVDGLIRRASPDRGVPALGRLAARWLVLGAGLTVVLHALGIEIGPFLAALGVGGLAVALALQETLGNLIAGVHILMERPFEVGDFVELEAGQRGTVTDVGWRTTRLRTVDDDVVVVPNAKVAGIQLLNFHLGVRRSRLNVEVRVAHGEDPTRVEAALLRGVAYAGDRYEILDTPLPDALLVEVGEWAQRWQVRFYVDDATTAPRARDAVNRGIVRALREADLRIALPQLVVPGHDTRHTRYDVSA